MKTKNTLDIDFTQFKIEKFTTELITQAIEKIQSFIRNKTIAYWNDYDLFVKQIEPISVGDFNRKYGTWFCNAKETAMVHSIKLVYSADEGYLSILPGDLKDDYRSLESYINIAVEFDTAFMNPSQTNSYNKQIIKLFKSIK